MAVDRAPKPPAGDDLASQVGAALASVLGGAVAVEGLRRLSAGASRDTWRFTASVDGGKPRELILQRDRPGGSLDGPTMAAEDELLVAAAAAGVPVPTVVLASTAAGPLGPNSRVTAAVAGESLGPRLVRAERTDEGRRHLAADLGAAAAAIHGLDPTAHPGLDAVDALDQLRVGLDLVGEARPTFELALRRLAEDRPPPLPPSVVHGDLRVGNLLVDGDRLTAVLDWELAHLGDPREDLGWLCVRAWRFGGEREVGGLVDLDDLLAGYRAVGGAPVTADEVRWWTVVGTLRWGLICAVQARRHLDGHVRSVELATIGRRVCETEHDLLDLLGVPPAAEDPTPTEPAEPTEPTEAEPSPTARLHGRPTAEELLDAVRQHLAEQIAPQLDGAPAFSLRVVDRALATVQREIAAAGRPLPIADEAALAASIRAGAPVDDAALARIRAAVEERLQVANPRWAARPR